MLKYLYDMPTDRGNTMKRKTMICALLAACLMLTGCDAGKIIDNASGLAKSLFSHEKKEYDSIPERWRNEHVSDYTAAKQAMDALLSSADAGDKEAFAKNFTSGLRGSSGFDKLIDDFFASYPGGMSEAERNDGPVSGGGSYRDGNSRKGGSASSELMLNGKWFYIILSFCCENTAEPENVGVESFMIMNLEAMAVHQDIYSRDCLHYDDIHLMCDIRSSNEVNARLINGSAFLWTDTDTPKLTENEMRKLLTEYRDLYAPEVREKIGKANAEQKFFNKTGYDYYYELAPENGEPRYAHICANSPYGSIINAYLCTADDQFYDDPLCPFIKPTE